MYDRAEGVRCVRARLRPSRARYRLGRRPALPHSTGPLGTCLRGRSLGDRQQLLEPLLVLVRALDADVAGARLPGLGLDLEVLVLDQQVHAVVDHLLDVRQLAREFRTVELAG